MHSPSQANTKGKFVRCGSDKLIRTKAIIFPFFFFLLAKQKLSYAGKLKQVHLIIFNFSLPTSKISTKFWASKWLVVNGWLINQTDINLSLFLDKEYLLLYRCE